MPSKKKRSFESQKLEFFWKYEDEKEDSQKDNEHSSSVIEKDDMFENGEDDANTIFNRPSFRHLQDQITNFQAVQQERTNTTTTGYRRRSTLTKADPSTGIKTRDRLHPNIPGLGTRFRGVGKQLMEDVSQKGVVLLVSEFPGEILSDEESQDFVDAGGYLLNKRAFPWNSAPMGVNTINADYYCTREKPNVSLRTLHSSTLLRRYRIEVANGEGYYAVITSIKPIKKYTFLVIKHYGGHSSLRFGSAKFLYYQDKALEKYMENQELLHSNRKLYIGYSVCPNCCQLITRTENKQKNHNLKCYNFVNNTVELVIKQNVNKKSKHSKE